MGRDKSYIDPSKCKECGQCAKACPYNAIADLMRPCIKSCPVGAISVAENGTGIAVIDKDKCIDCGSCIHKCPFGAIGSKSYIVDIINDMSAGKKVFAMFAPATYGQFGADITMASWRTAMKKIGFYDAVDVGLGADMTAMAEAKEWMEAKAAGKKKTRLAALHLNSWWRSIFQSWQTGYLRQYRLCAQCQDISRRTMRMPLRYLSDLV